MRKSSGVVRMMALNWLVSKWRFSLSSSRQHETTVLTVSKERREDYTLIVLGFLDSAAATRVIASQLRDISPYDPITFAGVGSVILLVGIVACYLPGRRATRVGPLVALRNE
jgi:hypothetical protein